MSQICLISYRNVRSYCVCCSNLQRCFCNYEKKTESVTPQQTHLFSCLATGKQGSSFLVFRSPDPRVLTQSPSHIHDPTIKYWTLGGHPTFIRQGKISHEAKDSSQSPEYTGLHFPRYPLEWRVGWMEKEPTSRRQGKSLAFRLERWFST